MLFNSFTFVVFFTVVTALYFLLPHKFRWFLLLAASCFFYMFFKPVYILILAFTIVIDYYAGILLENEPDEKRKKRYLVMSLVANIGVLAIFKYYNFLNTNVSGIALMLGYKNPIPFLKIALPIGLSFHTFQAMSYTIEIYRGNQKAERHFGIYALYVMFYPQLVAGPIERPQNMIHQFHEKHEFEYDDVVGGLQMIIWGLFKKAVIADRLALVTGPIFSNPHQYSATALIIGTVFFVFEIFCDFSGYSNIAIGTAQVMGYKLMTNFNRPYISRSISEFWRRWHISLSTWFYDYLFTPLSFSLRRYRIWAIAISSVITFLVSGLWHGAAWQFIIWGGLHGLAIAYEVLTKKTRENLFGKLPKAVANFIGVGCTFSYICFTAVFFRANTVADAFYILRKTPSVFGELRGHLSGISLPQSNAKMMLCVVAILVMESVHFIQRRKSLSGLFQSAPRYLRWGVYYVFVLTIIYFGVFNNRQFIYFQF